MGTDLGRSTSIELFVLRQNRRLTNRKVMPQGFAASFYKRGVHPQYISDYCFSIESCRNTPLAWMHNVLSKYDQELSIYFFLMRTPGLSSLRNWIPAFSNACWTWESVEVREPICPLNDSIRRIVPTATRERFASSICSQPSKTRAARNCRPLITKRP
jgi:hypothetical protein